MSVDPLFASYPWYTPYQFAGNMPIWAIDLDGLEEAKVTDSDASILAPLFYGVETQVVKETAKETAKTSATTFGKAAGAVVGGFLLWATDPEAANSKTRCCTDEQCGINNPPCAVKQARMKALGFNNFYEEIVTDPSTLSDDYLEGVAGRLLLGKASQMDQLYAKEAYERAFLKTYTGSLQQHHIIPKSLVNRSFVVRDAITKGFNLDDYLIPLPTYKDGSGFHAKHPNYTNYVLQEINKWYDSQENYNPDDATEFLKGLVKKLEKDIVNEFFDPANNNKNLNQIYEGKVNK